jgi:phosphoglycolate phosphatase-like HAD superfamily hydrolase
MKFVKVRELPCAAVAPDEVLNIGDTPYDAQAAVKAQLRTVGLLCGGWSGEDLRAAGCIGIYRDAADLFACYNDLPLSGVNEATE